MKITITNFSGGYIEHFENHRLGIDIKIIHFDCAPCGHIGNVDVHKVDNGYCLVNECGEFKFIR